MSRELASHASVSCYILRHVGIHPHLRRPVDTRSATGTRDTLRGEPAISTLLSLLAGAGEVRAGLALDALLYDKVTQHRLRSLCRVRVRCPTLR
jgi:hypothetical protein